jgi:hypothetical protein
MARHRRGRAGAQCPSTILRRAARDWGIFFPLVADHALGSIFALPIWVVSAALVGVVGERFGRLERERTHMHETLLRRLTRAMAEPSEELSEEQRGRSSRCSAMRRRAPHSLWVRGRFRLGLRKRPLRNAAAARPDGERKRQLPSPRAKLVAGARQIYDPFGGLSVGTLDGRSDDLDPVICNAQGQSTAPRHLSTATIPIHTGVASSVPTVRRVFHRLPPLQLGAYPLEQDLPAAGGRKAAWSLGQQPPPSDGGVA